tara:strand:- start:5 stop:685 length:681 start_codon:yes stop_codon:yes gene_type:complete
MTDHYTTLDVARDASTAEIRKAYRKAALRWHPDKNPGDRDAAEAMFIKVSEAYEILGSEEARAAYDRGVPARAGGAHAHYDFARASAMFTENFGEELAREWQPGMKVSGVLQRGGKRVSITIHPDGTTDEVETTARTSGDVSYVRRTNAGGGSTVQIQFNDGLGAGIAALLVPEAVATVPLLGPAVLAAAAWLPSLFCLACCYRVCCKRAAHRAPSSRDRHKANVD